LLFEARTIKIPYAKIHCQTYKKAISSAVHIFFFVIILFLFHCLQKQVAKCHSRRMLCFFYDLQLKYIKCLIYMPDLISRIPRNLIRAYISVVC